MSNLNLSEKVPKSLRILRHSEQIRHQYQGRREDESDEGPAGQSPPKLFLQKPEGHHKGCRNYQQLIGEVRVIRSELRQQNRNCVIRYQEDGRLLQRVIRPFLAE